MAEKKKLTVAEILAAARQQGGKKPEEPAAADEPGAVAEAAAEPAAPAEKAPAEKAPAKKPAAAKPAAGGARPSVADILAAARASKGEGAPAAEKKSPVEKKPAAEKNPAAEKPKPAEKAPVKEAPVGVGAGARDTASILASARKEAKPGPMSKAEAAKLKPDAPAKEPKAKLVVPPMPVKPEYAKPKPAKGEAATDGRRFFMSSLAIGFLSMGTTFTLWTLGFARFMFPNILTEPPSRFPVGFPSDFPPGSVDEKFKATNGVWIVNSEYNGKREIVALRTVCTHLGCTPNWLDGEQKFKCPCHGSGFYKDGINFEGPAPRPLERYAISVGDDGQLVVDKSKLFQEELGQWQDPACYVPV